MVRPRLAWRINGNLITIPIRFGSVGPAPKCGEQQEATRRRTRVLAALLIGHLTGRPFCPVGARCYPRCLLHVVLYYFAYVYALEP